FVPITGAGNGRGVDDPGANGSIAPVSWTPVAGAGGGSGSVLDRFTGMGYYGSTGSTGFDGEEFYLQIRIKLDPNRWTSPNPAGGKAIFFCLNNASNTSHTLVME